MASSTSSSRSKRSSAMATTRAMDAARRRAGSRRSTGLAARGALVLVGWLGLADPAVDPAHGSNAEGRPCREIRDSEPSRRSYPRGDDLLPVQVALTSAGSRRAPHCMERATVSRFRSTSRGGRDGRTPRQGRRTRAPWVDRLVEMAGRPPRLWTCGTRLELRRSRLALPTSDRVLFVRVMTETAGA